MNLTLIRSSFKATGIFGALYETITGKPPLFYTLEHAYPMGDIFGPKLPAGIYVCKLGWHQLEGMSAPFKTYEITGVAGHSGILFHAGNWNHDSDGCILLGISQGEEMIYQSRSAFEQFMELQMGCDTWELQVLASA